mgnify:CR=1 FL=1
MKLVENIPLNTNIIAELIPDQDDLFLVWPKAKYPFDHGQWRESLNPEAGNVPFLIYDGDRLIGQAAIRKTDEEHKYSLSCLYIMPELRSKGLGQKMLALLEQYAKDRLGAEKLCLVVRTYNPRAQRCYLKCGFSEDSREGTLIRMSKRVK